MAKAPVHAAPATVRPGLDPRHTPNDVGKVRPKGSSGPGGDVRDPRRPAKPNGGHLFGTFSD